MELEFGVLFRLRSVRLIVVVVLFEVEFYFYLLVLIYFIDIECYKEVRFFK